MKYDDYHKSVTNVTQSQSQHHVTHKKEQYYTLYIIITLIYNL